MGLLQGIGDLNGITDYLAQLLDRDDLTEGEAVHILHFDVLLAVVLFDPVDRANVGVVQRRSRPCLLEKAGLLSIVGSQMMRKEFQRDDPVELRILGFVDHAHAALAELVENLIVGYCLTDHGDPSLRSG